MYGASLHGLRIKPQTTGLQLEDIDLSQRVLRRWSWPLPFITTSEQSGALQLVPYCETTALKTVERLSRSRGWLIEKPLLLSQESYIAEAREYLGSYGHRALIVVNEQRTPIGLLTATEVNGDQDDSLPVHVAMRECQVVKTDEPLSKDFARDHTHIVVLDSQNKLRGLLIDEASAPKEYPQKDRDGGLCILAATPIEKPNAFSYAQALQDAGASALYLTSENGHHRDLHHMVTKLRQQESLRAALFAGPVCTLEGVKALYDAGADGIIIGRSQAMETLGITGTPLVQLLPEAALETNRMGIPLILQLPASQPQTIIAALALGANAILLDNNQEDIPVTELRKALQWSGCRHLPDFPRSVRLNAT